MNDYLSGFILGLVQGMTEFLPVSSSGHLMLLESLGVGTPDLATNLALHVATLLAVFVAYGKKIVYLIKHPFDEKVRFILLATVPTGILAGIIRYFVPQTPAFLPFCFLLTSAILLLPKILKPKERELTHKLIPKSLFVGCMQGLACLNGVSRSGSTVTALRLAGVNAEESAELSFLLSIPIIVASATVECITAEGGFHVSGGLFVGMATAFIVGLGAIKLFLRVLKKDKTAWFSAYTFLLGIASFFIV